MGHLLGIIVVERNLPVTGFMEGYSGGDARHVANFRLAARLRERRPASRKDWVTTLSPTETGRAWIIPPDSPKTKSSTCAHRNFQMRGAWTSIRGLCLSELKGPV